MRKKKSWTRTHYNAGKPKVEPVHVFAVEDPVMMTLGAGGCHRCAGWVVRILELTFEDSDRLQVRKCLLCGARVYEDTGGCHEACD